jgi:transposase
MGSCSGLEATAYLAPFVPETTALPLDSWPLAAPASRMTWSVTSTQRAGLWPLGAVAAERRPRRSTRPPTALPWAPDRVRGPRRGRTWGCQPPLGVRQRGTARLPMVAAPWARRPHRAVAHGGTAGAPLSHRVGAAGGRTMRWRLRRRLVVPSCPPPGSRSPRSPYANARRLARWCLT